MTFKLVGRGLPRQRISFHIILKFQTRVLTFPVRTLQVSDISPVPGNKPNKFFLQLTDGGAVANAMATTQVGKRITAGEISNGDVVDLTSYSYSSETGEGRIFMIDVGTVQRGTNKV